MVLLLIGLVLFLGAHSGSIFMAEKRRDIIASKGKLAWMIPYTVVSLVGFLAIIWGYGYAREEPVFLYQFPVWMSLLNALLMLFAFIAFVSSTISGKIAGFLKHPQLVGLKIWALAHLLVNGDIASIILFGSFLAWAVANRISLKKRVAAGLSSDNPGGPIIKDFLAVLVGTVVYVVFVIWAHEFLFGVAPFG